MIEILLLIVCLLCVSLKKSYRHMAAYPPSIENGRLPVWLRLSLDHSSFLVFVLDMLLVAAFSLYSASVAFSFELGWVFLILFISSSVLFLIYPKTPPTRVEERAAILLSKPTAFFLKRAENPIKAVEKLLLKTEKRFKRLEPMDKKAIKSFLLQQKDIAPEELKTDLKQAVAGLEISSEKVRHFMITKKKAKFVKSDEQVGPIILSELHGTSRRVFPVKDGSDIVGTVRLDSLAMLKSGGKASEVLDTQMVTVMKNDSITAVVQKFIDSGAELVFVENETSEIDGMVYLEDILDSLV